MEAYSLEAQLMLHHFANPDRPALRRVSRPGRGRTSTAVFSPHCETSRMKD
jgi:hypothetical protein